VKRWMTIEEVKKQEWEIMMQSEDKLVYYVHINGNDYGLLYQFYNDELVWGMLILNGDNIVNSANHIDIFEDLGDMYIKKYWDTELKNRIDSPFDNDRSNWWLALDVWALTFMYEWETPTTIIEMYVTNFWDWPTVSVNHKSKELYSKFEEKQQSNELNKI
jgi:hypothetical protein